MKSAHVYCLRQFFVTFLCLTVLSSELEAQLCSTDCVARPVLEHNIRWLIDTTWKTRRWWWIDWQTTVYWQLYSVTWHSGTNVTRSSLVEFSVLNDCCYQVRCCLLCHVALVGFRLLTDCRRRYLFTAHIASTCPAPVVMTFATTLSPDGRDDKSRPRP